MKEGEGWCGGGGVRGRVGGGLGFLDRCPARDPVPPAAVDADADGPDSLTASRRRPGPPERLPRSPSGRRSLKVHWVRVGGGHLLFSPPSPKRQPNPQEIPTALILFATPFRANYGSVVRIPIVVGLTVPNAPLTDV